MKKPIIALLLSVLLVSCHSNTANAQLTLGKIINSAPVLTADKQTLIFNYNKNLLQLSGINGNFSDVNIVQIDTSYYLVFTGRTYKSSLRIQTKPGLDNVMILIEDGGDGSGHVSCTTSECASEPRGCVPSTVGLSCTPCANSGKCTKTVSIVSLLQ